MNEKGANLRRVVLWIEQRGFAPRPLIAAIESLSFAPAAASHDQWHFGSLLKVRVCTGFRYKIRSVCDELSVYSIDSCQCALNLGGSVVVRLQTADRSIDQPAQYGDICRNCRTNPDTHGRDALRGSVRLFPSSKFTPPDHQFVCGRIYSNAVG